MAAADLLVDLLMMDVSVALDGDQLRLSAPKGVIDAALRECIAAEKPALIEALRDCRAGAARSSSGVRQMAGGADDGFSCADLA